MSSAGLYIPLHLGLWEHKKFRRLCRILKIQSDKEQVLVMGHLCHLWFWVLRDHPTGTIVDCSTEDIADYSKWSEDPDTWVSALLEAGFLIDVESEGYKIPNWENYAGRLFRYRRKEADRKARYRDRKKQKSVHGDIPGMSPWTSGESRKFKAKSKKKLFREEVEAIYQLYPKKTTKKESLEVIGKLLEEGVEYEFLRRRTEEFAQSPLAQERKAKGMLQDPVRFFKHRRFEDDPAEWQKSGNGKVVVDPEYEMPSFPEI